MWYSPQRTYMFFFKKYVHNFFQRIFYPISIVSILLFWIISERFQIYEHNTSLYTIFSLNSIIFFFKYLYEAKNQKLNCLILALSIFFLYSIRQTGFILALILFIHILLSDRKKLLNLCFYSAPFYLI